MSDVSLRPQDTAVFLTLEGLSGHPVRLTLLDPHSRERRLRLTGLLSGVTPSGLTADVLQSLPDSPAGSPVTVELLSGSKLVLCHTELRSFARDHRTVYLGLPDSVQTLQRRRYPRLDLELPLHVVSPPDDHAYPAVLRDISAGGASLTLGHAVEPGAILKMIFNLGSGLFFRDLPAECLRCAPAENGYVIAVRFRCSPEHEAKLAAWVERQLNADQQTP